MKMKSLMAAAVCVAMLASCNNNGTTYTVRGEIEGENDGMIYLKRYDDKSFTVIDSAEIVDGRFIFSGEFTEPMACGLSTNRDTRRPLLFFLDGGESTVNIDEANAKIEVSGSESSDIYFANLPLLENPGYSIDSLIQAHPASVVPAYFLMRNFAWQLPLERVKELREKFDPSISGTALVASIDTFVSRLESLKPGAMAPDFTLPDTLGNAVSLSDFRGRYLLLDFWASWCPDCRRENPKVVEAFKRYGGDRFAILSVSLDRERDPWLAAIANDSLTWTHVCDLKDWKSDAAVTYAIRWIPTSYIIDPEGRIVSMEQDGDAILDKLETILGASDAQSK
jgi:peroxiredoxin